MKQNLTFCAQRKRRGKSDEGSGSKRAVEIVARHLPNLNRRSFSLSDFHTIAEQLGIDADEMPLRRLHGCSFPDEEDPDRSVLWVNSLLTEPEKIIAAFHELTHILMHPPGQGAFASTGALWNRRKIEREAQSVGIVALLPLPAILGRAVWEIEEAFGVKREVARCRLQLFVNWGI